jgi:hypothetical protein
LRHHGTKRAIIREYDLVGIEAFQEQEEQDTRQNRRPGDKRHA